MVNNISSSSNGGYHRQNFQQSKRPQSKRKYAGHFGPIKDCPEKYEQVVK